MNGTADVIVIGGGVIGCSVAYHAARLGAKVTLLEAEQLGCGSSGALAGMLSGQGEAEPPGALRDLMLLGRDRHRNFSKELYETTKIDPGYVWDGALKTSTDAASDEDLIEEYHLQKEEGLETYWLRGNEVRELEPAVSSQVTGALYMPDDGHVNPPQLVQALALGAVLRGSELLEATRATGFILQANRVAGVHTTRGRILGDAVVLAGGVFSSLLSAQLGVKLPLYPVKGQMVVTNIRPSPVKANIWGPNNFYLVPKRDGRMIVGATEEHKVYDRQPTLGGVAELSQAAVDLIPKLSEARFTMAWGGLRPAMPYGNPILGPIDEWEGLFLATGHLRNGVLLSVITGEVISALALGEAAPVDVSPFRLKIMTEGAT